MKKPRALDSEILTRNKLLKLPEFNHFYLIMGVSPTKQLTSLKKWRKEFDYHFKMVKDETEETERFNRIMHHAIYLPYRINEDDLSPSLFFQFKQRIRKELKKYYKGKSKDFLLHQDISSIIIVESLKIFLKNLIPEAVCFNYNQIRNKQESNDKNLKSILNIQPNTFHVLLYLFTLNKDVTEIRKEFLATLDKIDWQAGIKEIDQTIKLTYVP